MNLFVNNEEDAKRALIGTLIADGHVEKQRTPNGRAMIEITHTARNLDYLKFKKQLFEFIPNVECEIKSHNKTTEDKSYELFRLCTNKNDYATYYRDNMYQVIEGKRIKLFRPEDIEYLSDLGLLLLYLDDGTLRVRYYEGTNRIREIRVRFCLECFTVKELNYFQS